MATALVRIRGAYVPDREAVLRQSGGILNVHWSIEWLTSLSLYHDSQFSAFSTEVLARIHSECLTGDALHSLKCDCGFQLAAALRQISEAGRGVLIYHREEGRGIGLINKIRAYALQDQGMDTIEANLALGFKADERNFNVCADMFELLGVKQVRLMTNNPQKVETMKKAGINIVERVPLNVGENRYNTKYLDTKAKKMGHYIVHDNE